MKPKSRTRIWPLVLFLVVLFILSLLAPRKWNSIIVQPVASVKFGSRIRYASERVPARADKRTLASVAVARPAQSLLATVADDPTAVRHATAADRHHAPASLTASSPDRVETVDETWLVTNQRTPTAVAFPAGSADEGEDTTRFEAPPGAPENSRQQADDTVPPVAERPAAGQARTDTSTFLAELQRDPRPRRLPAPEPPAGEPNLSAPVAAREAARLLAVEPPPSLTLGREAAEPAPAASVPEAAPNAGRPQRQPSRPLSEAVTRWPYPVELATRLETLAQQERYAAWSRPLLETLRQLPAVDDLAAPEVADYLNRLQAGVDEGEEAAAKEEDLRLRTELQRAAFALRRRLAIWQQVHAIATQPTTPPVAPESGCAPLPDLVAAVETKLAGLRYGPQWRTYLLLDECRQCFAASPVDTAAGRSLARRCLLRIDPAGLSPAERNLLQQPELAAWAAALRRLAIEPVDYFRVMEAVERYEAAPCSNEAGRLAIAQQTLRWAASAPVAELGRQLDANYRNANVRISVSQQLIERLVPGPQRIAAPVDDVILGARTVGQSETLTRLQVHLVPSSDSWRIGLRADGEVASSTYSNKGPATFYSAGTAVFRAEKELTIDAGGARHSPAQAAATSATGLTGLATTLDPWPLLGDVAQNIARRQYEARSGAAQAQVDQRVTGEAERRFDDEVEQRLAEAKQQFVDTFYTPMRKLSLNPMPIDLQTTSHRLIARYRLAAHHQLAAHTPRPQAPGSSVLSVQVHESAPNNFFDQLGWAGRESRLQDLAQQLAELFHRPAWQMPEDFPEDVIVEFAAQEPVRVAFQQGRVGITLNFAELRQGRNRWRDFTVRVYYRPAPEQPGADLVRDQYVELIGKRLHFRDQVALRGIFSRVFARNQPIDMISKTLAKDTRLQGLAVTQIAIDDGWIGVAIGPAPLEAKRPAETKTR